MEELAADISRFLEQLEREQDVIMSDIDSIDVQRNVGAKLVSRGGSRVSYHAGANYIKWMISFEVVDAIGEGSFGRFVPTSIHLAASDDPRGPLIVDPPREDMISVLPRVCDLLSATFRSFQRGYHAHLLTEAEDWEDHALRVRLCEPEVGAVQDLIDCAEDDADNLAEDVKSKREHREKPERFRHAKCIEDRRHK